LLAPRGRHTVSVIGSRAVFVGGRDAMGAPRSDAEVADLLSLSAAASGSCFAQSPSTQPLAVARAEHAAVVLPTTQEVLVLGGVERDPGGGMAGQTTPSSEVFSDFARRQLLGPVTN
jgi:hypothetical protein